MLEAFTRLLNDVNSIYSIKKNVKPQYPNLRSQKVGLPLSYKQNSDAVEMVMASSNDVLSYSMYCLDRTRPTLSSKCTCFLCFDVWGVCRPKNTFVIIF